MFGIVNAYLGSRMTGVTGRGGHAEPDGQALKSSALAGAAQTVVVPGAGWGGGEAGPGRSLGRLPATRKRTCVVCQLRGISEMSIS